MDLGRLKTAAILILALVNLAFGGILLSDRLDSADSRAQSRQELALVMEKLGVDLDADILPEELPLYSYTLTRDHSAEALLASALLGEAQGQDQGGNIYYYENENGWARFRGSGSFELALTSAVGGSIEERLQAGGLAFLRQGGEYVCAFQDVPVFNCRFSLSTLTGGGLLVSGRRLPGTPASPTDARNLSVAAVLLRFRDEMHAAGSVFTRIEAITQGYSLSASAASAALTPVWRIETDGGTYTVDALTGTLLGN